MKLIIKLLALGIGLVILGIIAIFLINLWVVQSTKSQVVSNLENLEKDQVGLLLGTTPRLAGGYANPYFTHRIDAAAQLYHAGVVRHLILSGDNSMPEYNEPQKMLEALVKKGVPKEKMTLDYAGFRTLDSVIRSQAVFQQDSILIISQNFHNPRAVFIANHFDIETTAFDAPAVFRSPWSKVKIREYIARCLAVWDLYIWQREPKFYGDKVDIE